MVNEPYYSKICNLPTSASHTLTNRHTSILYCEEINVMQVISLITFIQLKCGL